MKTPRPLKYLCLLFSAVLLPFCGFGQTYQTTDYTNSFDNNGNTGLYQAPSAIYWYSIYQDYGLTGTPPIYNYPATNDAAVDADGDTNLSGSLYIYTPFNSTSNHDQNVFYFTLSDLGPFDQSVQIPLALVTNISFKIHVDPKSKPDPDGTFGTIKVGLVGQAGTGGGYLSGANSSYFQSLTIPGSATNGWVTLAETNASDAVNFANGNASLTNGFGVDFDYNNYGGLPTNPVGFWIDDVVVLTSSKPAPPPPPPVLSIQMTQPGLNLFAGQGAGLYQRESLETDLGDYSWINVGHPVSLSFTIADYPIGPNDQFQTHMFLIPAPGTESAPDYTEPNLVFFDLESTTNGANWMFRFKTNEPNGNAMVYGSGTLATISNPTAVGTWTATFNNNTNVTLRTPSGTTTNFSIPDPTGAIADLFSNDVELYFGVQAGNAGGANDHIVVSDFSATGFGVGDFNDDFLADNGNFSGPLEINANYPSAVQLLAPGNQYFLVEWTIPALGYNLLASSDLNSTNNWQPLAPNGTPPQFGSLVTQIVSTNELPGGNGFFELVKPGQ